MKESQVKKIEKHLLYGRSITSWEAIQLYRCTRLSAVIYILRERGHNIKSTLICEDGTHYSVYKLE